MYRLSFYHADNLPSVRNYKKLTFGDCQAQYHSTDWIAVIEKAKYDQALSAVLGLDWRIPRVYMCVCVCVCVCVCTDEQQRHWILRRLTSPVSSERLPQDWQTVGLSVESIDEHTKAQASWQTDHLS
jgi:hypothetical protein